MRGSMDVKEDSGAAISGQLEQTVEAVIDAGCDAIARKPQEKQDEIVGAPTKEYAHAVLQEGRKELVKQEIRRHGGIKAKGVAALAQSMADKEEEGRENPAVASLQRRIEEEVQQYAEKD